MFVAVQLFFCSAAVALVIAQFRQARGASPADSLSPSPRVKDPRALAWLRSGRIALIELALYDLARRGLLVEATAPSRREVHFVLASTPPDTDRLSPLEVAILLACESPCPRGRICGNPAVLARVAEEEDVLRSELSRQGLAVSAVQNGRRLALAAAALLFLAFGTAAGLTQTVSYTRDLQSPMLCGIFLLTMVLLVGLSLPLRNTAAGDRALRLQEIEQSVRRLRLLYEPGTGEDLLRMRAIFGMEVSLGAAEAPDAKRLRGWSVVRR